MTLDALSPSDSIRFSAQPRSASSGWLLLLSSLVWIVLASLLRDYDTQLAVFGPYQKLDLRLSYSAADVAELFQAYGEAGRGLYAELMWLDNLFALSVGVWGHLMARQLPRPPSWLLPLIKAAPWLFCGFDLVENGLVLTLLESPGAPEPSLVNIANWTTRLKLFSLGVTYTSAIWVLVQKAWGILRGVVQPPPRATPPRVWWSLTGLSIALPLTVVQSSIWNGTETPQWMLSMVPPTVLATPELSYDRFGRLFIVVPLILLAMLEHGRTTGLNGNANAGTRIRAYLKHFPDWQSRLVLIALIANFFSYWVFGYAAPEFRKVSFWAIEVPVWLLLGLGTSVYGVALWKASIQRLPGALFLLPAMLASAAAFRYLPHALVIPALLLSPRSDDKRSR